MKALLPIGISCFLALSCSAEPPDDGVGGGGPDAGVVDDQTKPRIDLDPIDGTTPFASVPITGTGPARGTIVVETAVGNAAADIGSDGSFCLDVNLQIGIANTLWIKGIDENGIASDEIELMINQEGAPEQGGSDTEAMRNVARYGTVTHNLDVISGKASDIVDGNLGSFTHFENALTYNTSWLMVRLSESGSGIDHIKVIGTDECPIEDYYVLLSDVDEPQEPSMDLFLDPGDDWTIVKEVEAGGVIEVIEPALGSEPRAKHVALTYIQEGCESFGPFGYGDNEIKELEVWVKEKTVGGGDGGPTCGSGAQ